MPTVIPGIYPRTGVVGPNGNAVIGPRPSTLHSVARWMDQNGTVLGDSEILVDEAGNLTTPGRINGRLVAQDGANVDALMIAVARLPSTDEKAALAGTDGVPSATNKYVTDSDPRLTGGGGGGGSPTGPAGGQLGGTYPNPDVRGLRETGGPTALTISSIPDGTFLKRSGSSIIGQSTPFVNEGVVTTAVSLSLTAAQTYCAVTSTAATRTITLPAVGGLSDGHRVIVADESGTAGNPFQILVDASGSETINGSTVMIRIARPRQALAFVMRGAQWWCADTGGGEINVLELGADPTGVADSLNAFKAAIDLSAAANRPTRIVVPTGNYYLSDTLEINRPVHLVGYAAKYNLGSALVFKSGRDGIRLNYFAPITWQANQSPFNNVFTTQPTAGYSGLLFRKVSGSNTGPVEPTWPTTEGATVTESGVGSPITWKAYKAVTAGSGGSIIEGILVEPLTGTSAWQASTSGYVPGTSQIIPTGSYPTGGYDGFVYVAISGTQTGASEPTWPTVEGQTVTESGVGDPVTWEARYVAGFKIYANVEIRNCVSTGFPGDGFSVFASTGDGNNANSFSISHCQTSHNMGWGYFAQGADSNAGLFSCCGAQENGTGGFWDNSFLGNTYVACTAENNGIGGAAMGYLVPADHPVNASSFFGCYTESGQSNLINGVASWYGNGRGEINYGTGQIIDPLRSSSITFINDSVGDGTGDTATMRVGRYQSQVFYEFSVSQSPTLVQWQYGVVNGSGASPGWIGMNCGIPTAYAISLSNASLGAGQMWIPNDLWRGGQGIQTVERFVGGTNPTAYTSDAVMARGVIREGSNQVSGAYGWMRVADIGDADGWAIMRPHRARTVAVTTVLDVRDYYVEVSAVPVTITLPATGVSGARVDDGYDLIIRDTSGTASVSDPITISRGASETIDGGTSVVIDSPNGWIWFQRRNGNWRTLKSTASGVAGGDLSGSYPNPKVTAITESAGPTSLAIGNISNNQILKRSGTSIIGVSNVVEGTGTFPNIPYWSNGGGGPQQSDSGIPYTSLALNARTIVDVTGNTSLAAGDTNKSYTNHGASGTVILTAPASPATGYILRMRVKAAQTLTFQLPTGHTLYIGDTGNTTAGGTVSANTVGSTINVEYAGNNTWFTEAVTGSWTPA